MQDNSSESWGAFEHAWASFLDEYDPVASESWSEQAFKDHVKSDMGGPGFQVMVLFHERRNAKRLALTTLCGWIKGSREETPRWKDCEGFAGNCFMLAEDVFNFETDTTAYCALLWAGRMMVSCWWRLLGLTFPKKTLSHFQYKTCSICMFHYYYILHTGNFVKKKKKKVCLINGFILVGFTKMSVIFFITWKQNWVVVNMLMG